MLFNNSILCSVVDMFYVYFNTVPRFYSYVQFVELRNGFKENREFELVLLQSFFISVCLTRIFPWMLLIELENCKLGNENPCQILCVNEMHLQR